MITDKGKDILAKYLIGQAPAYASYVAIGCGAKALPSDHTFTQSEITTYAAKKSLDFEAIRVPIISRGYAKENGTPEIVFTAELPTEERYEITEVGIFSAGENTSAGAYDSRTLYSFSENENWEFHNDNSATSIPAIYTPLDDEDNDNIINTSNKAFQTNADNRIFTNENRVSRNERSRFLNNIIVLSGNISNLTSDSDGNNVVNESNVSNGGSHIHLSGISTDFDKQSPTDEIRLAFSIINRDGQNISSRPSKVMLLMEFSSSDQNNSGEYARYHASITHTPGHETNDFTNNRYFVINRQLQALIKTSGFSWSQVNIVKIYATILDINGNQTDQFFIGLDAVRLENLGTENPLYGMTGYAVVRNTDSNPIVKSANTTNFIEFRFGMDVQ